MTAAPPALANRKQTAAYFAERGVVVHPSTITRHLDKFPELRHITATGHALMDPAAVFESYTSDYTRRLHSGEASGARPAPSLPLLSAPPPSAKPGPAPAPAPPSPPVAPSASSRASPANPHQIDPTDPARRRTEGQAKAIERANAEAEGALVPAASVQAACALGVAELKTWLHRRVRPTAEQIAALTNSDSRTPEIKAILNGFIADALNRMADAMARELGLADTARRALFARLENEAAEALEALLGAPDAPHASAAA